MKFVESKPRKHATRKRDKGKIKAAPPLQLSKCEMYVIVRDAFKNDAAFATAQASLQTQMVARGGDGTLCDIQCYLDEDGQTVFLWSDWKSDDPAGASFKLAKPTSEEDFEAGFYIMQLEEAKALK